MPINRLRCWPSMYQKKNLRKLQGSTYFLFFQFHPAFCSTLISAVVLLVLFNRRCTLLATLIHITTCILLFVFPNQFPTSLAVIVFCATVLLVTVAFYFCLPHFDSRFLDSPKRLRCRKNLVIPASFRRIKQGLIISRFCLLAEKNP